MAEARHGLPSQRRHVRGAPLLLPATPQEWLEDKRQRDQARAGFGPNLWLIHCACYDLTDFAKRHPGGRTWIDLTRGMDATQAFETHHIDTSKARQLLAKYAVAAPPSLRSEASKVYSWQPHGFYATVRQRAKALLATQPDATTGPTRTMLFLSYMAVLLWMLAFAHLCHSGSLTAACLAGFLLLSLMGVGHNFFHQRDSQWLRYVFDLTVFSHHDWRISHVLSHHGYPNLDLDIEASQLEPWATFMRSQPANGITTHFVWPIFLVLLPVVEVLRTLLVLGARPSHARPEHLLKALELGLLVWAQGPGWGAALFAIMHAVSFAALFAASFPVHRSEYGWTEGCQAALPARSDFGEHVLLCTHDYGAGSLGLVARLFLAGSFNDHVVHHLFPTLDMSRQPVLRPMVLETMREFKVPHESQPFWSLLCRTITAMHRLPTEGLKYRPPRSLPLTPGACKRE